jgi:hypothetical protein
MITTYNKVVKSLRLLASCWTYKLEDPVTCADNLKYDIAKVYLYYKVHLISLFIYLCQESSRMLADVELKTNGSKQKEELNKQTAVAESVLLRVTWNKMLISCTKDSIASLGNWIKCEIVESGFKEPLGHRLFQAGYYARFQMLNVVKYMHF